MTGALKRWEKRPKAWTETWQCLHHDGPTRLSAELVLEGSGDRVARRRSGPRARRHDDASGRAGRRRAARRARLGPRAAVVPAVPRLRRAGDDVRHALLALRGADAGARPRRHRRAGRPAQRHAAGARQPAQGGQPQRDALRRPARPRRRARRARRRRGRRAEAGPGRDRAAAATTPPTTATTPRCCAGSRASRCRPTSRSARRSRRCGSPQRAHDDAAKTDATRATNVAALLHRALAVRDPEKLTDDCPVCGTPDVLDEAWAKQATEQAAALDEQAQALTRADAELNAARRRVDGLLDANARAAPALARSVGLEAEDVVATTRDEVIAAAAALRTLAERATTELTRRGAAWQELSTHVATWLERRPGGRGPRLHAEGGQGRRDLGQGRRRRPARGALRPDLRARDRELARAAPGLGRRPARHHAQEVRPERPRGLRRARRR